MVEEETSAGHNGLSGSGFEEFLNTADPFWGFRKKEDLPIFKKLNATLAKPQTLTLNQAATPFYALHTGNSGAVQAYLQAPIGKEAWVRIPGELCLPEWRDPALPLYQFGGKTCRRLAWTPDSSRRWQVHLQTQLKRLGGCERPEYPSGWIFRPGCGNDTLAPALISWEW